MADKLSDQHKTTVWSKTFGAHADPNVTALNSVKGFGGAFRDEYGPMGMSLPAFFMAVAGGIGGLMAGVGGASISSEVSTVRYLPAALDTEIHAGIEQSQYGVSGFEHDGMNYMLVHDGENYRLFQRAGNDQFSFVEDVDDAYAIIRKAGENMIFYARALDDPSQNLPEDKPEILEFDGVSVVHGNASNAFRYASNVSDHAFSAGNNFADVYEAQGDVFLESAAAVLKGGYGFDVDQSYAKRDTEVHVTTKIDREAQEITYVGLGILGLVLGGGLLGGTVSGISAGRRASRRRKNGESGQTHYRA